jgi:hypothetical protein
MSSRRSNAFPEFRPDQSFLSGAPTKWRVASRAFEMPMSD